MTAERTATCRACGRPVFPKVAQKTGGLCRGCDYQAAIRRNALAREAEDREARRPLTAEDFQLVRRTADLEVACSIVFTKAHSKWSEHGRSALTTGELTVIAVEIFFGEVCNGGLVQYLGNASAFAEDLAEALMRVGLPQYVPLAIELRRLFPSGIPHDVDRIFEKEDALEELTSRFFELHTHDGDPFREVLAAYIRNNEDQFVAGF